MRLAVVIPTLDEAAHLPRLFTALLGAEVRGGDRPDDVVVVDGGSCDGTAALAREEGARVCEAPRGRGSQLSVGAQRAEGELLLFLHADTVPAPGALSAMREGLADGKTVAAGMRQVVEAPGRLYRWIERAADRRVRRGLVYGDSALGVRRDAYEAVGGFRADLALFEDLDLSRRLRRLGEVRLLEGAQVSISARRWEAEGVVRRTLWNQVLKGAWSLGVDPRFLVRYYRPRSAYAESS